MRTAKGTRNDHDWEKAPGKSVTCPVCGKMLQKSSQTNSVIYCPRCGYPSYTYLEDNIKKLTAYEKNGIFPGDRLILSFETKKSPINQKIIGLNIDKYLK